MPVTKSFLRIEGARELEAALRQLPDSVGRGNLRRTLKTVAEPVRQAMEDAAPRSPVAPHLAQNIVVATTRKPEDFQASVAIGPKREFFYGHFSEFGTSREPARPWMRPAWDAQKAGLLPAIGRELWGQIKASARRLARRAARARS